MLNPYIGINLKKKNYSKSVIIYENIYVLYFVSSIIIKYYNFNWIFFIYLSINEINTSIKKKSLNLENYLELLKYTKISTYYIFAFEFYVKKIVCFRISWVNVIFYNFYVYQVVHYYF